MKKRLYFYLTMGLLAAAVLGCGNGKDTAEKGTGEQVTAADEEEPEEGGAEGKELAAANTEEKTAASTETKQNITTEGKTGEKPTTENTTEKTEEKVKKTTEERTTQQKTTEKKKPKKTTEEQKKNKTTEATTEVKASNREIAQQYIGATLDSLVAAIGSYTSFSKAESCYYEGEYDGIAQFDGFTVYCHSQGQTTFYIDSVE